MNSGGSSRWPRLSDDDFEQYLIEEALQERWMEGAAAVSEQAQRDAELERARVEAHQEATARLEAAKLARARGEI